MKKVRRAQALTLMPLLATLVASYTPHAHAEDLTVEQVSELSFDELLNFNVSVASSQPESIPETPAIVSRYDAEDLKRMGVRDLKGFLSMVPGLDVVNSIASSVVSIRGVFEGFNQKVLFLLNGVPYFMPSHSDIPLLGVPLESISHIEVIRGPGAVYHGTNASGGVINVVTKESGDNSIKLSAGSRSLVNAGGYLSRAINDESNISVAYEVQETDGYMGLTTGANPHPFISDLPTGAEIPRGDTHSSLLLRYNVGSANFMAQAFQSESKVLAGFTSVVSHAIHEQSGYLLHANYDLAFDHSAFKIYADYNRYGLALPTENQVPGGIPGGTRFDEEEDNNRLRIGLSANFRFSESLEWYSVLETETRESGNYELFNGQTDQTILTIMEGASVDERSFATQLDYSIDSWRFLLGGRFTDNELADREFTPRLSAVYSIDENQSLKLLYAGGFNSPNIIQQRIFVPNVIYGNSELEAESVRTYDLVYTRFSSNALFSANVYYVQARDFIERESRLEYVTREVDGEMVEVPVNPIYYINKGNFDRSGVELDYQYAKNKWQYLANLAYMKQGNTNDAKDVGALFNPKLTMSGGISYRINSRHGVGASIRYWGNRNDEGRAWVSNFDYRYTLEKLSLNLTIRNLANKQLMQTDLTNLRASSYLQSEDKSNVLLGVRYTF